MKRLSLLVLLAALAVPAWAQNGQPPTFRSWTFNLTATAPIAPAATPWISLSGTGTNAHQLVWTIKGTVSTCSVKLQQSEDGVSWADLITAATCTSSDSGTLTTGSARYVRVNATTFTGSGSLTVTYFGFVPGQALTATVNTSGLSTSVKQSDGTQKTQVVDGSGNVIGATSNALDVNIKSGGATGGTSMVDDAAFTPAVTSITPVGFTFDDVAPDSVNEGDGGIGRMSANRNQYVTIRDAAGNERGMNIDANGDHGVTVRSGGVASGGIASGAVASGAIASGAYASGSIGSGAIASGAVASGAFASGALASGSVASGAYASGALAAGSIVNGADVTQGTTTDDKCTTTDTTACTLIALVKGLNYRYVSAAVTDPCSGLVKVNKSFTINSATTTVLVAASASNKLYVCSFNILPVAGAMNFELVEDAQASCVSPDAGIIGSISDGTGAILVANQGMALGNGAGTTAQTASTNVNVCIITSSTNRINGNLSYVLAP